MPSDRPGSPEPLARLADVLARAASGTRPTPLELAELLWLARHMTPASDPQEPAPPGRPPAPEPPRAPGEPASGPPAGPPGPAPAPPAPPAPSPPPAPPAPPRPADRSPLHLPAPDPTETTAARPHASVLAPAPPMLRHPLDLQRALRPLKRHADSPVGRELDERATADRIARLGLDPRWWLPVLRPARERWLRLRLVHDTGPTMPVWRPLIRELHTALAQSGVFRTVTAHRADPDGTVRGEAAHAPADGRTVTLLVSDCMGAQWRPGPAGGRWYRTLRRWAHRMPLALVQPLPEHLWRDTALPAAPGRFTAPHPAAPTSALVFTPYDTGTPAAGHGGAVPLPVLEAGPDWLANWASLVADPGGTPYPGAAALLHSRPVSPDTADRADLTALSAEELVLRFRATASPEAFRLAGHLALGRPDLPVMRLVQAAVEPDPRPAHLAEVILSGMLARAAGPPGSYAFRPGVRELLLRGLPRSARDRTSELLRRTGGLIDERAGRTPGEFRAFVPARHGSETAVAGGPFAEISPRSARQLSVTERVPSPVPPGLGTRYRPARRLDANGRLWLAEDVRARRTVALKLHRTLADPAGRAAFLRDAGLLRDLGHPGTVTVHDFGIEDDVPYVVMEHVDGITLHSLAASAGHRLPPPLTVSVGAQLARALTAVHGAGLTHGALEMARVILLPDGTVKLTLFEPGRTSGPAGRSDDLRALGEALVRLASGTSHPAAPIDSRHLRHLPPALRGPYGHALDLLRSRSHWTQTRGLELLLDPQLATLAREAYRRRTYRVLGPLRVETPDGPAALDPRTAAMLAMLLFNHGRTVTLDELRWGLWHAGEEPPGARTELHRMAAGLREVLGPGALATLSHGLALHTSADYVDVVHCEDLVRRADAASRAGGHLAARGHLTRALALWHGDQPLPGVPGSAARTARGRLLQLRLALYRKRAETDLSLGAHERAAADLARLVRAHPSREDLRRLYLIALRRQGRIEEALDVYEEYELSGGRDPDLYVLGQELREERAGPVEEVERRAYEPPPDHRTPYDPATGLDEPDDEPAGEPAGQPARSAGERTAADLIARSRCVLLGFDDVLARLYRPGTEREVLLDVMRLLAEDRDPGEALTGAAPLPRVDPVPGEGYAATLDLVRAFAGHRLAGAVRLRLDRHEERAARTARPTPLAHRLIRALHTRQVPLAVVTDRAEAPVETYLRRRGLLECLPGGVHGRTADLRRLMPDPDVLHRALEQLGADAGECVLVGSSVAEQAAARAVGLPFIGCRRGEPGRGELAAADPGAVLVPDLRPLLTAAMNR
ncbi:SAV_2336 N-terminal domain-related protein [Streptomyces sp. NPDC000134]|uniref:SAV_2336 N-terminal domain-related protein n=1 Tax=Streptomyces sp. NPDC000134 TaxID=3364536 RepID=UPI00369B9110